MQSLYYIYPSGSFSSSLTIVYGDTTSTSDVTSNYQTYFDITLEITASTYPISGSIIGDLRVFVKSGSIVYASFPMEDTNIYYNIYPTNLTPAPPVPFQPAFNSSSFNVNWSFTPNSVITSSLDTFSLSSGSFSTSSVSIFVTQSYNFGLTTLQAGKIYDIVVSGSGYYYTSSLSITNNATNTLVTYITASNSYITASFSSSVANTHTIVATTSALPSMVLTYNTSSNFPITSSNIDDWNKELYITASILNISGSTVTLAGGDLGSLLYIDIKTQALTKFQSYGLYSLISCSLYGDDNYDDGILDSFPTINNSPYLSYLNLYTNIITSSIPNLTSSQSLQTLIISNNHISGSIPNFSSSYNLQYFDCETNYLTGSIDLLRNYNLQHFNCNSNQLSGSIGSLNDCFNLQYFDCSYNHLTGSIPNFSSSYNLQYFNCRNNNLIGNVTPPPSSIIEFDVSTNYLTGGTPNLSGNTNLYVFYAFNNQLSGSIRPISGAAALVEMAIHTNHLTGSIPSLYYNPLLTSILLENNQLTTYVSASGTGYTLSPTLTFLTAQNNLLVQSSVDGILIDLDNAGGQFGYVNLTGAGNSTPSAAGLAATASLVSKSWAVYVN